MLCPCLKVLRFRGARGLVRVGLGGYGPAGAGPDLILFVQFGVLSGWVKLCPDTTHGFRARA
jgi:hypothetical protein